MGEHAVEHAAAGFVAIEALCEVIAQITSGLRDAEGQRVRRLTAEQVARRRAVAQMTDDVARGGEADAEDTRLRRLVAQFVDRSRFRQCCPPAPACTVRASTNSKATGCVARSACVGPSVRIVPACRFV